VLIRVDRLPAESPAHFNNAFQVRSIVEIHCLTGNSKIGTTAIRQVDRARNRLDRHRKGKCNSLCLGGLGCSRGWDKRERCCGGERREGRPRTIAGNFIP